MNAPRRDAWTRDELREELLAYDTRTGHYPEDEWQGLAIWMELTGPRNLDEAKAEERAWLQALLDALVLEGKDVSEIDWLRRDLGRKAND